MTAAPIRVASAAAADQVVTEPAARAVVWSRLPAPHRVAEAARHARGAPEPVARAPSGALHVPADLRALVGQRDSRDPLSAVLAWERELGTSIEAATGSALVAWADSAGHASAPTSDIAPGDLLVFDRTEGAPADLVAIAIARDARGVTELVYLAGGVVRRGFVDPRRPATRRDSTGAVVNTFMRTGKLWPPKGTHYLAGELLSRIVRAR